MLRTIQKSSPLRGILLEPYISTSLVTCNYTSGNVDGWNRKNLPKQPVPKLEDTFAKYLRSVKPFLNDCEFAKTTAIVKDFQQCSGKKLQAVLEKRAKDHENWLEDWWINTAYLRYRDPVVVYSSPGLLFPYRKFNTLNDQLTYAAKLLLNTLKKKVIIDQKQVPQEKMGKNILDMSQYTKAFGTCRIPIEKQDKLSFNSTSTHINVIHNNHIFHLDFCGQDGVLLNEEQIVKQFEEVIKLSCTKNDEAIGFLTSENRDTWAKAYKLLLQDKTNKESLKDIETSVVVLCLDAPCGLWNLNGDDAKKTLGGLQTIHGCGSDSNGGNRWFDKTIQFIVGADGVNGITYEHSPAEGQPIALLADYILKHIDEKTNEPASECPVPPKLLKFNVTPEISCMIKDAKVNLDKLVANLDLDCFKYTNYGKNFIKSQKMSPDSYLQMAMQYAFYRLHKVPGAHYESAATRMFAGGRTETIRSCSVESIQFAQTMLNKNCSPKDKVAALRAAVTSHKNYTVQALQGLGVDRHLLGLKLAAIENGMDVPELFKDVSFTRSSHMRISTSQVALKADAFMCYGATAPDGYSTCYNPRNDDMIFGLGAFVEHPDTDCRKYRNALEQSLQEMHDVLVQTISSKI